MKPEINIIPIFNDRVTQIANLIIPIQQIEFNVPITLEGQPDLLDIEANYHKDGGCFWGAIAGDQVVGTIALMTVRHQAGAIRKMFVKKEFRGKELGTAQGLLDTLIDHSRGLGITMLYLGTVDVLKAAHRFYERNHFVRIDAAELPSYFPRMTVDTLFYSLDVTQTKQNAD